MGTRIVGWGGLGGSLTRVQTSQKLFTYELGRMVLESQESRWGNESNEVEDMGAGLRSEREPSISFCGWHE